MVSDSSIKIYGYEDYEVFFMHPVVIDITFNCFYSSYPITTNGMNHHGILMPESILSNLCDVDDGVYSYDIDAPYKNNKELLADASKLYFHPNCSMSRTVASAKYSKCLSPWTADAVVVPDQNSYSLYKHEIVLFVNDKSKQIFMFHTYKQELQEAFNKALESEDKAYLKDFVVLRENYLESKINPVSLHDFLYSELVFCGNVARFSAKEKHLLDAITGCFPLDKTVFECSVQESLSSDNNQISLEELNSISEMLKSSDEHTVSAALKSLSMLDWMHFKNSILYLFGNTLLSCDNSAMSSTPVKYMMNHLFAKRNYSRYRSKQYDEDIYQQDYDMILQILNQEYHGDNNSITEILVVLPFTDTITNEDGSIQIRPVLKE